MWTRRGSWEMEEVMSALCYWTFSDLRLSFGAIISASCGCASAMSSISLRNMGKSANGAFSVADTLAGVQATDMGIHHPNSCF